MIHSLVTKSNRSITIFMYLLGDVKATIE